MRNISPEGEICCFLCSACNITHVVSTVKRWVLIFWVFFANLDFTRFATLFLPYNHHFFLVWHHFDTNFLFLVSANCYAFQPCDFTLNSGHLTYMVIYVHCYIYVGVSHNILKNFYVYSLFCHSGTSRMSHNVWACPFIPVINWFLQRRKKSLNQIIVRIVK